MKVFLLCLFVLPCFADRGTLPWSQSHELKETLGVTGSVQANLFESVSMPVLVELGYMQRSRSRSTTSTRRTTTTSSAKTYQYQSGSQSRINSAKAEQAARRKQPISNPSDPKPKTKTDRRSKDGATFEFIDVNNEAGKNSNAPTILQIKRNKFYKKRLLRALWREEYDLVLDSLEGSHDFNEVSAYDETLLHLAAEQGNLQIVKRLLEHGHDHSPRDKGGFTPLMLAGREGHLDIVKALHQAGADLNGADLSGTNSLMWAGFYGRLKVVKYLLNKRALKTMADSAGHSAIDYVDPDRYPKVHSLMHLLDIQPGEAGPLKGRERTELKYRRFEGVL